MKDLPLLPGEVNKAVDVYLHVYVNVGVLVYLPGKDGEPVGRVGVAVRDNGVIGFGDEGRGRRSLSPRLSGRRPRRS